ncbi:MAG TPA: trypsin-like peptidase domain-containing protein [Clostridia bacterium]|nr:trypsin-like peptidase domain-containing protein [Clostridia bacterium]
MKNKILVIVFIMVAVTVFAAGCGAVAGQNYTLYKYIDTVYSLAPQKLIDTYQSISASETAMTVSTVIMPCTYEIECTIFYSYSAYFAGSKPGTGSIQKVNESVTKTATAFMINENGYLLTNAHVITLKDASSYSDLKYEAWEIKINLAETDTYFNAYVTAYDTELDLAILRVSTAQVNVSTLEYVVFYNLQDPTLVDYPTTEMYYGEPIIMISNTLGYGLAVSQGIVSAPRRYFSDGINYTAAIQINTAVNQGDSGGALCNVFSRVVGMTTHALTPDGADNVGFAIPSYTILRYIDAVNTGKSTGVVFDTKLDIKYYYTNLREYAETNIMSNYSK